ncbi:MAG: hypothetical protein ACFNKL_00075 [Treponema sp.]
MSKNHRGTGLRNLPAHGRGTCPVCKADNIKLLYEQTVDGQQAKVCKYCNAAIKRKAAAAPKPATEQPAAEDKAE